jgi:hypothetical protein
VEAARWVALVVLAGCATSYRDPPDAPPTVLLEGKGAAMTEVQEARAAAPGCVVSAVESSGFERALAVRLGTAAPAFVLARRGAAKLELGPSPKRGARASVTSGGITVRGVVAADDVWLYLARPVFLAGVILPRPEAELAWLGTSPRGRTLVRHALEQDQDSRTLSDEVPCAALALAPAHYDAVEAAERGGRSLRPAVVRAERLAVASSADAQPSVTLDDATDAYVEVMEEAGDKRRILWERDRDVVSGWVASATLGEVVGPAHGNLVGEAFGYGGLGLRGIGGIVVTLRCNETMRLYAEHDGKREHVGEVAAGIEVRVGEEQQGVSEVHFLGEGFEVGTDTSLWVQSAGRCRRN